MATFNSGGVAQVKVGTTSPPSILLEGVKSATYTGQRPTNTDDFYNQEASDVSTGKATRRMTITGVAKSTAPGLVLLKASFDDDTGPIIYGSVSQNGTTGEALPARVSNIEVGFPDPNRHCTYSFQLEQGGDPVALAGGNIFD